VLSAQTSWMFGFCHLDDVITRQRKQTFGSSVFDNFFKTFVDFKNQSRYASGFYDVKGSWWAIYLKKYKTFAYHL